MKYSMSDLAHMMGAKLEGFSNQDIQWLLMDSRALFFPDERLFFALKTSKNDGHRYIGGLYERGLRAFVVSDPAFDTDPYKDAVFLWVDDGLKALQRLAEVHRRRFSCPVLAITGSNGKTIVKEWLWQLLREDLILCRSPRSYNSQIGVPLSVWQMDDRTQLAIFEAGISQPGEMKRLETILHPTVGLFTNIGAAHQENFETISQKLVEKLSLFSRCTTVIFNQDQEGVEAGLRVVCPKAQLFAWSRINRDADVYVESVRVSQKSTRIVYHWVGQAHAFLLPFDDASSVENALHCLAFMLLQGYKPDEIHRRIAMLEPIAMRLEVLEGKQGCSIINDGYNADVNALEVALDFQAHRTLGTNLTRTIILSDILQSGEDANVLYTKLAALLHRKQVDLLIGVGPAISAHADCFPIQSQFFLKTDRLLQSGLLDQFKNMSVLLKGARAYEFELISERLAQKVHETVLEVNLDALLHNVSYFKSLLHSKTQLVAMVKAAGYGSGALEVARSLQTYGCGALAVAVADEGAELRRGGITMPIWVMNPEFDTFSSLVEHRLEPEIYSFKLLNAFIRSAEREGVHDYPIHIKLDTGMHRLGFEAADVEALIDCLKSQNALRVRTVFSHLAGSDEPRLDAYTQMQLSRFEQMSSRICSAFSHRIQRHILNSAGIERFSSYQYDMVRLGIGMYGISSVASSALKQVSTLKTTILQIKALRKGETVGYGRRGILERDSRIATLPIGYADGLNRHLGNGRGFVLIAGQRVPFIGSICMDASMIDVTDVFAEEGDVVYLFGEGLPISEVAEWLDTIPYEVLTSVSNRVKRIYFKE